MRRVLFCLLCLCALPVSSRAHVLDEYLQAAQITIAPARVQVELRLTAGVESADRVFALIDTDRDGQLSPAEEQAYALRVRDDVVLEVDGRRLPVGVTSMQFPSRSEMKKGDSVIRLELSAETAASEAGEHYLIFRNKHLPELGIYQSNALLPATDTIAITEQRRDALQHELQVSFRVISPVPNTPVAPRIWWPLGAAILLTGAFLTLLVSRRVLNSR